MYTFKASSKEASKLCLPVHASLAGVRCGLVWPTPKARKYKRSCNMQCLKQLGALCPYINNSNKSLPTEKCLLTPFWKAVIYSTLEGRDRPVNREHGYNGRVENPQDFDEKNLWTLSVKTFFFATVLKA